MAKPCPKCEENKRGHAAAIHLVVAVRYALGDNGKQDVDDLLAYSHWLRGLEAAAGNLLNAKGRHNSKIAYDRLSEFFALKPAIDASSTPSEPRCDCSLLGPHYCEKHAV